MSEEILGGDMSLHVPERISENVHRVKAVNEDASRDAREQYKDTEEERKKHETSEGDSQDKSALERSAISVHNWESIHDDVILSETAQRLMDQSQAAKSAEPNHEPMDKQTNSEPVPHIHLTA